MCSDSIEFNVDVLNSYLNNQEWAQLTHYLREKFMVTLNDATGKPNPIPVTQCTIDTLSSTLKYLDNFKDITPELQTLTKEIFRSLRNCSVFNFTAQTMIAKDPCILQNTHKLLHNLLNSSDECVKMILQFLTNLVTKNLENALAIWTTFKEIIMELFKGPQYAYHASALLYNIVYLKRSVVKDCSQLYSCVLEGITSSNQNEYHLFLFEIFVQEVAFMNLYDTFESAHKITILSGLEDLKSSKSFVLDVSIMQLLATKFKEKSDCILKTVTEYVDDIEPQEVVLLLEILASLSSEESYRKQLQDDRDLIINCAFLLRNIHILGKESQNNFTPIQKLSDNIENQKNPVFGFKASLIRFLGNVCWKNRENQDKLRELDCIPLLLDCCNIDERNPFIIQWTIFAIRNLCENNPANQAVIAGMTRHGTVDYSTLQEMGLTLHNDGTNQIILGPLPEHHS